MTLTNLQRKAMFANKTIPKNVKVYDYKKGLDRYTILIGDGAFGMSSNPFHPQGFDMFVGDVGKGAHEIKAGKHLGKKVDPNELSDDLRHAIIQRIP